MRSFSVNSIPRPGRAQILVAVREMILRGELRPRKTIEEVELSVRATLAKLQEEGLLQALAAGGYTPRVFTEQDIADAIEARGALEGLAAGLAAQRVSDPAQLARARRINAEIKETIASFVATGSPTAEQMARYGELNLAFHQALIALAKSPMLQLSLDSVQSIAFASPAAVVIPAKPAGFSRAVQYHDAIINAIKGAMLRAPRNWFGSTHDSRCMP
jgi:GntR family transcriptional regulator, vanillate catabolism transcriptional regulator